MSPASSLHLPPSPKSPTHSHYDGGFGRSFAHDLATPSSLLYRPVTAPSTPTTTTTSIMDQLLLAARPLPPLPMSTQGPPMIDLPEVLCLDDLMAIASSHSGGDDGRDEEPHSPAPSTVTLGGGAVDMSIPTPPSAVPIVDEQDESNGNEDHVEALAYALHELACGEADFAHLLVALAEEGVPEFLNSPMPTSAQLPDDPMADSTDSRVYVRHLPDLAALHLTLSGSLSDHDVAQFLPANDDGTTAAANSPSSLPTGSVEHAAHAMALAFLDALSAPNAVSLYTTACAPLSHALAQWRLRVPDAPALVAAYQTATMAPCNVCGKLADAAAAAAAAATSESRSPSHIPDLDSLLASVMQRITRYPLLWSSIRRSLARLVGSEIVAHAPVPALMAVEMAEARAREVAQAVDEAKQEYDRRVRAFAFWMNAVPKPFVPVAAPKVATIKRCCSTADESLAHSECGFGDGCAAGGTASSIPTTPTAILAVLETGALDASVADHADGLLEVSMLMSASARVSVRNWWQGDYSTAAFASLTSRGTSVRTSSAASIAESVEDGPLSLVLASGLSMEALMLAPPPNPPESSPASLASTYPDIPMDSVGRTLTLSRRSTRGVNRRQSSSSTQSMVITSTGGGMSTSASEQGSLRRPLSTPPTSQLPTPPSSSSSADTYVDMQPALPPLPSAIPPELSSCYWNTINSNRASSIADSGIAIPVMPPMPPEPQYLGFFLFSDGTLVAASPASPPSSAKQSSSSSSLSLKRQSMMVPADEPASSDSQSPKYHIRYVWRLREDGWGVQELLGSDGVDRFGLRLTGPLATVDFYARSPRVRTSWLAALYSVLCPGQIATPFPSWAWVASTATPTATPLGSPNMTPSASFSTISKHQQHQHHPGSPSIGAVTSMSLPPLDLPPLADDALVLPTFVEVPLALPGMPLPSSSTLGRPSTAGSTNSDDSGIAHTASVRKSKRTSRVWQGLTRAVSRRTKSSSSPNSSVLVAAELDRAFAGLFTYIPAGGGSGSSSQTWRASKIAQSSSAVDVTKYPRPLSRAAKSTVDVPSQAAQQRVHERRASSAMDLQALVAAVMAAASRPETPAIQPWPPVGCDASSDALTTLAVISRDRQVASPEQVCTPVGIVAAESEDDDDDDDDALFVCPPSRKPTPAIAATQQAPPAVQVRPPSPLTIPARIESLQRSSTTGRRHSSMVRSKSSPAPLPHASASRSCVSVVISSPHPRSTSLLSAHTESLLGPPSDSDIGEPLPLGRTPSPPPAASEPVHSSHFVYAPGPGPLTTPASSTGLHSSLGGNTYSAAMHSLTNGGRRWSASLSPATGQNVVTSTMDDLGFEPVAVRTIVEEVVADEHHGQNTGRQHKWGKGWVAKWSRRVSGIGSASSKN